MKITKFGHCCLLIKENSLTILTDPGDHSEGQNSIKGIDVILITHEHSDHLHIDSLKQVLANNPEAKVITNKGTGALLQKENIPFSLLEYGQSTTEKGIVIEGFGEKHEVMYPGVPQVDNTGYFIANKLFYPGDAFTNPNKPVDILALPVAGPWMKLSEAIDYAKEIKPKLTFPVHDGSFSKAPGSIYRLPSQILEPLGVKYLVLELNRETEL